RIFVLERRNRMNRVRTANGLGRSLREAEVAHLALLHELGHRAHGVLDRRIRIDAMLVIEVDMVDAQSAERAFDGLADVLGPSVDPSSRRVAFIANDPELGREYDLLTPVADRPAHELLVLVRAVHI